MNLDSPRSATGASEKTGDQGPSVDSSESLVDQVKHKPARKQKKAKVVYLDPSDEVLVVHKKAKKKKHKGMKKVNIHSHSIKRRMLFSCTKVKCLWMMKSGS